MAYVTVEVDVEMDEFDLDEILDELEDRWNCRRKKKENREQITEFFNDLVLCDVVVAKNMSIVDSIKVDFIKNNLDKISINDLENLIK